MLNFDIDWPSLITGALVGAAIVLIIVGVIWAREPEPAPVSWMAPLPPEPTVAAAMDPPPPTLPPAPSLQAAARGEPDPVEWGFKAAAKAKPKDVGLRVGEKALLSDVAAKPDAPFGAPKPKAKAKRRRKS